MNIGKLLTRCGHVYRDRPALVHGPRQWTYAQFDRRANRLAQAFYRLGLKPRDHVALLMYNYPEMLEAMFACFKAGLGAVPINFRLHPSEFAYIIDHSQAKAVVLSPEFNAPVLEIRDRIPAAHLIALSGAGGEYLDYEKLLSAETGEFEDADMQPDDIAWLFYTSGTTGRPKGAMLTHRNLLAMTLTFYADFGSLGPNDAILHAAPLSHGSGLYALPNVAQGAANVILESKSFEAELVFKSIEKYRITNLFAAPTMVKLLIDNPAVEKYDLSSLKSLIYGGGPMHVENLLEARRKLGPCLTQLYGMGETPMTITYLPHEDHVLEGTPEQMKRLASAGFARTGVEVRVVDARDRDVPRGEMGEVAVRSDVVTKGYWRDPEATAGALRGGWLHSGDVGYLDEDGYLFLMDRSKDMIISGGENIYPREVEEVVIQHPAVREVAVIGVPDPTWGEAVKAVVVLRLGESTSEEEIIAFCKDRLASYKKPKSVDFVDALPRSSTMKVLKTVLRETYGASVRYRAQPCRGGSRTALRPAPPTAPRLSP
ncbi:MAG: long-chain fatty acid--CoA ligase [Pseudomonadota bacterium]